MMPKAVLPTYSICSLTDAPALRNDIMVDRFSHYLDTHKNLHFPHKHSFYHLVYFTQGAGYHSIDFVNFKVEHGQVYFMVPGQVHSWDFNDDVDGYIINFSHHYLDAFVANPRYLEQFNFFSGIAENEVINIPGEGQVAVQQLFETILKENSTSARLKDDMVRLLILQLFIVISRYSNKEQSPQTNNYNSLLLHSFQKLIDENYKEKKLTKEYAEMLYVTPNHLNALSKDVTGRSAGEIIRDRVLLEAKRLLVNANITVSEIANELNFQDNSYFTKFFKKYVGVTPEVFRKQFEKKVQGD
jgi:AraC-like DNA-binding protein